MKKDVTFDEMAKLIDARLWLLLSQHWLWTARVIGHDRIVIELREKNVLAALDRVWEAQQRAARP